MAGTAGFTDDKASRHLLDTAYEVGYRTFDTARVYGNGASEKCIGRWIKQSAPAEITVITKCAHPSKRNRLGPADLDEDLHASLRALKVECLDMLLLHRDDPSISAGNLVSYFNDRIREGKIRAYGVSNWQLPRLKEALEFASMHGLVGPALNSVHYSLGSWSVEPPWPDCLSLSKPDAIEDRKWYKEQRFPVLAWSSLCGGFYRENSAAGKDDPVYASGENGERRTRATMLAKGKGVTLPQLVLAYIYSQSMLLTPITYSRNREHFIKNLQAAELRLTDSECSWLNLETD